MDKEKQPLINELCAIAVRRNEINTRRHRARYRKNYYAHALAVVEAHNGSNRKLRYLESVNFIGTKQAAIDNVKSNMEWLKKKHPKPVKWQTMGLHKLRSLILKNEGEYAMAKHETMEFTIKYRDRVKYLSSYLCVSLKYEDGSIVGMSDYNGKAETVWIGPEEIIKRAAQYELNASIEEMIQE